MNEFALIRDFFSAISGACGAEAGVRLGIGDDAAVLSVPPSEELVVAVDTLVAGRHFPECTAPADVGWKSLAVNLSDLAAMGAQARWCTLALSLPEADPDWLQGFCEGFAALARAVGIVLVGGDTTRGPLTVSVTVMGTVPAGTAIRRDGARPGDCICVTGTLGDAALALQRLADAIPASLRERLDRPVPRLVCGLAARGLVHAAIDLSDGLKGDLQHVLDRSGVGADLFVERLPMSEAFKQCSAAASRAVLQLTGGDDYELCFCVPPTALAQLRESCDMPLTEIGVITATSGLRLISGRGDIIHIEQTAYRHFED